MYIHTVHAESNKKGKRQEDTTRLLDEVVRLLVRGVVDDALLDELVERRPATRRPVSASERDRQHDTHAMSALLEVVWLLIPVTMCLSWTPLVPRPGWAARKLQMRRWGSFKLVKCCDMAGAPCVPVLAPADGAYAEPPGAAFGAFAICMLAGCCGVRRGAARGDWARVRVRA